MKEEDERKVKEYLSEIDKILTTECFFCGSLLIDMIDNDINDDDKKDDEFDIE